MPEMTFSKQLSDWLNKSSSATLGSLDSVFGDKSFAILILILMALPALPLPTGGISHVLELITMLLSLEVMAGFQTIWLPKRWRKRRLGKTMQKRALPFFIRRISTIEKFYRPRWRGLIRNGSFKRFMGLLIFLLTLGAFIAPPFSGLDTLPSMGVVVISLAWILEDSLSFLLGLLVGVVGVALEFAIAGAAILTVIHWL